MELSDYQFSAPLLVEPEGLVELPASDWESGEVWLNTLSRYKNLRGIVLPLELASKRYSLQEAMGIVLLNWLRWSADEPTCRVPVLAVAVQPLEVLLRRTRNLLLVEHGTEFCPRGACKTRLDAFVNSVREPQSSELLWADSFDQDRLGLTSADVAMQISYHDLANDYYSASRLWAGYKSALDTTIQEFKGLGVTAIEDERKRAEQVRFAWEDEKIKSRMRQPHVRQYLAAAKNRLGAPLYPVVPKAEQVIRRHVENGLPPTTRILLVDDEFDKGLADVLLQILFGQSAFSAQNDDVEWVYSEGSRSGECWARLVCVKTADLAVHWLAHWGEVDYPDSSDWTFQTDRQSWLSAWAKTLNVSIQTGDEAADVLGERTSRIDRTRTRPKGVNTVVLLDLRLEPTEQRETHDLQGLKSVQLRKLIKRQDEPLPIIMLTASRQAMTYAVVMDDAERADGWLTKEGPDTSLDNENSARAVHYLLERLHLFSCVQDWYRDELCWDHDWKLEYSKWRGNPQWEESQDRIEKIASQLFWSIQQQEFREKPERQYAPGLGWANQHTKGCSSIERLLIVRRVVIAALVLTADWQDGQPHWNPDAFNNLIPGKEGRRNVNAVYDVVKSFKGKLWLVTSTPNLLGMLLREEFQWLAQLFPKAEQPELHVHLAKIILFL